jgi:hypothetical protein
MNEMTVRTAAMEAIDAMTTPDVPRGTSAWVLDLDVQRAIDAAHARAKGRVSKRRIINGLLRAILIADAATARPTTN